MFRTNYNFEYLIAYKFGIKLDTPEFEQKKKELKESLIYTECIDDFSGNSHYAPCWADIYKFKDEFLLVVNTHYFAVEKIFPYFYYVVTITEAEFNELKDSKEDFDYEFLRDRKNLVSEYTFMD